MWSLSSLICYTEHMKTPQVWHTIIIGAGASGLMCAGSFDAPKLVLEHNTSPGRKLNITGGGKCNFTHETLSAKDYVCTQKHFPHAVLAAYPPRKIIDLFQSGGISCISRENGCIFAHKAADITQFLFQRAKQHHTTFSFNTQVLEVTKSEGVFRVRTSKGLFYAMHVVIAGGGLSYPQLGATSIAWQIAQSFGLQTVDPRAALAGFRLDKPWRAKCALLAGNALAVQIRIQKHIEDGQLLFTHEGISGPAVLQTSLYWKEGDEVEIDFCPGVDVLVFLRAHKNNTCHLSKILQPILPVKICKTLLDNYDVRAADASKNQLLQAVNTLKHFRFIPQATTGYTHAEVTAGGIDTRLLDPRNLQCKSVEGLYFIGEAIDVTGRMGGYNLHWAWASALAAANNLSRQA